MHGSFSASFLFEFVAVDVYHREQEGEREGMVIKKRRQEEDVKGEEYEEGG